jgi:hypothetical protein
MRVSATAGAAAADDSVDIVVQAVERWLGVPGAVGGGGGGRKVAGAAGRACELACTHERQVAICVWRTRDNQASAHARVCHHTHASAGASVWARQAIRMQLGVRHWYCGPLRAHVARCVVHAACHNARRGATPSMPSRSQPGVYRSYWSSLGSTRLLRTLMRLDRRARATRARMCVCVCVLARARWRVWAAQGHMALDRLLGSPSGLSMICSLSMYTISKLTHARSPTRACTPTRTHAGTAGARSGVSTNACGRASRTAPPAATGEARGEARGAEELRGDEATARGEEGVRDARAPSCTGESRPRCHRRQVGVSDEALYGRMP